MVEQVIDFHTDGSVESLYSNEADLSHLGKQSMNRASHVLFNESTQLWVVEPVGYDPLELPMLYRRFATYKEAVDFEVALLNQARKIELLHKLATPDGIALADMVYATIYNPL